MKTNTSPDEYGSLVRGAQGLFARVTRPVVDHYRYRYSAVQHAVPGYTYPWHVRNLANLISVARLFLSVGATWLMYLHPAYAWRIPLALALMLLAASDGVDGAIARGLGTESTFGAAFDPIADKIMFFALAWFLLQHFHDEAAHAAGFGLLVGLVVITFMLEILTLLVGLGTGWHLRRLGLQGHSSSVGKVKYVAQCAAVALGWLIAPTWYALLVCTIAMTIAWFLTLVSFAIYYIQYLRLSVRRA